MKKRKKPEMQNFCNAKLRHISTSPEKAIFRTSLQRIKEIHIRIKSTIEIIPRGWPAGQGLTLRFALSQLLQVLRFETSQCYQFTPLGPFHKELCSGFNRAPLTDGGIFLTISRGAHKLPRHPGTEAAQAQGGHVPRWNFIPYTFFFCCGTPTQKMLRKLKILGIRLVYVIFVCFQPNQWTTNEAITPNFQKICKPIQKMLKKLEILGIRLIVYVVQACFQPN